MKTDDDDGQRASLGMRNNTHPNSSKTYNTNNRIEFTGIWHSSWPKDKRQRDAAQRHTSVFCVHNWRAQSSTGHIASCARLPRHEINIYARAQSIATSPLSGPQMQHSVPESRLRSTQHSPIPPAQDQEHYGASRIWMYTYVWIEERGAPGNNMHRVHRAESRVECIFYNMAYCVTSCGTNVPNSVLTKYVLICICACKYLQIFYVGFCRRHRQLTAAVAAAAVCLWFLCFHSKLLLYSIINYVPTLKVLCMCMTLFNTTAKRGRRTL